jgi:hypothetical protein
MNDLNRICSLPRRLAVAALVLDVFINASAALEPALEPAQEHRIVFGPDSAAQWSAAESTVAVSIARTRTGSPVLHWHVTVDHFAGEAAYPIGWPRAHCTLRDAAARDWSEWDYFQFWIYTDSTRDALPREPVGLALHVPDKDAAYRRPLTELKKGAWVQVRIPLSEVPRRHDVRMMQVHISESNYRHRDRLDFYFDDIVLARYARPTLLEFAPECAVAFADVRPLAVTFQLAGVKADQRVEVVCEMRQGGNIVARTAIQAGRGPQRVVLDRSGVSLPEGDYEVLARVQGGAEAETRIRLVESPWK